MAWPIYTPSGQFISFASSTQYFDPSISCYSKQGRLLPAAQRMEFTKFAISYILPSEAPRQIKEVRLTLRKTDKTGFVTTWFPFSQLSDLRQEIYNLTSIHPGSQVLRFRGVNISGPDTTTLLGLGLHQGGIIHIINKDEVESSVESTFLLNLQFGNLSSDLYVKGDYTVGLIKKNASSLFGIEEHKVMLAYASNLLFEDEQTLDKLRLVPRAFVTVFHSTDFAATRRQPKKNSKPNNKENQNMGTLVGKIKLQSQYILDKSRGLSDSRAWMERLRRSGFKTIQSTNTQSDTSSTGRIDEAWMQNSGFRQLLGINNENTLAESRYLKTQQPRQGPWKRAPLAQSTNIKIL